MTLRKNSQPQGSLDAAIAGLPARFLDTEVYADGGSMTGLVAYTNDLSEHLREELGTGANEPPTVEVMTAIGIPPAEWYRALLTQPTES
jgi:hypothetical protein